MTTPRETIEIRPVQPTGRIWSDVSSMLRNWRLRANPANGTLRLTEDRVLHRRPVERVFALPATGRADAITTLCLTTFEYFQNGRTYVSWRMLLLDREDRVVGTGRPRDEPKAGALWPVETFAPLAGVGIRTTTEWYSSPQALERAHAGAAPRYMLWTWRTKALIGIAGAVALLLVVWTVYLATR